MRRRRVPTRLGPAAESSRSRISMFEAPALVLPEKCTAMEGAASLAQAAIMVAGLLGAILLRPSPVVMDGEEKT